MEELIPAAKHYADVTGRRVIFEYALVADVNSSEECAAELASKLRGINCHVNLIPLNSVKERSLNGSAVRMHTNLRSGLKRGMFPQRFGANWVPILTVHADSSEASISVRTG